MVLGDLGKKITEALSKLNKATVIDEKIIDGVMKDIVTALLQADVNIKYVLKLRTNIKN